MALNREGADTAIKVTRLCSESGRGAGGQADDQVVGQKGLTSSLHPERSTPSNPSNRRAADKRGLHHSDEHH